jgi:putative ABC transport system substrate-binding protein
MLYMGPDTFIATTHRRLVAETALALRLPSFSVTELIVRSDPGALCPLQFPRMASAG